MVRLRDRQRARYHVEAGPRQCLSRCGGGARLLIEIGYDDALSWRDALCSHFQPRPHNGVFAEKTREPRTPTLNLGNVQRKGHSQGAGRDRAYLCDDGDVQLDLRIDR